MNEGQLIIKYVKSDGMVHNLKREVEKLKSKLERTEKQLSLYSVSQRTWNSAEIINELYQFETIDEAKRWFREYGG